MMITLNSSQFEQILLTSASLRAEEDFDGAINLLESMLPALHPHCLFNVYHELFLAHDQRGDKIMARHYLVKAIEQGGDTEAIRSFIAGDHAAIGNRSINHRSL